MLPGFFHLPCWYKTLIRWFDMPVRSFKVTIPQSEMLDRLTDQTGLSFSEFMRRMIDQCLQEYALNNMIPHMSGKITIGS